jgi:hypothetical protein
MLGKFCRKPPKSLWGNIVPFVLSTSFGVKRLSLAVGPTRTCSPRFERELACKVNLAYWGRWWLSMDIWETNPSVILSTTKSKWTTVFLNRESDVRSSQRVPLNITGKVHRNCSISDTFTIKVVSADASCITRIWKHCNKSPVSIPRLTRDILLTLHDTDSKAYCNILQI